MAKAGRKKKPGRREPNGRKQREAVLYDRGSDITAAKFSVYGTDGSDAIGRAYRAGLLGDDGVNLLHAARKLHRAYWPMLGVGRYSCPLDNTPRGAANDDGGTDPDERQRRIDREVRLTETLRSIDRMSRNHRRAFDQLVIDINPDSGPPWLESLIWHTKQRRDPEPADLGKLALALEALGTIAG